MNNYILIKITGKDVKRFVLSLYKKGINFYNIKYQGKICYIKVTDADYKKIKDIKTIYKIEIVRLYGFIKLKDRLNRYKIFIISILIGLLFMFFLSNIILDVEVVNDKEEIREFIYEELEKYGIKKYNFVKDFYKNEEIVEKILDNNKDKLEWMEIERVGNKYIVKVEQRKINNDKEDTTPRSIIAKKKGIIIDIIAETGEVIKKVNDYVNIGDVIISGEIKNKDKVKDIVHATGKVFAETWYNVKVELPLSYKEKSYTGNNAYALTFKFLNKEITTSNYKDKEEDIIFEFSNLILPIKFGIYKEKEINYNETLYTYDFAVVTGINLAKTKLLSTLGEEDKIIYEKCLKINEIDSKIVLDIFFKVKEDITDYSYEFKTEEETKQNTQVGR